MKPKCIHVENLSKLKIQSALQEKKYFQEIGKLFIIFLIQDALCHQILSSSVHHESKEGKVVVVILVA